jgi:hypothetical protein
VVPALREGIRARANASQDNPTPAKDFARDLLPLCKAANALTAAITTAAMLWPFLHAGCHGALAAKGLIKRFGLNTTL